MIKFLRGVFPILDRGARRRLVASSIFMMMLAALEGLALLAIAPLMLILTAPNMQSTSRFVTELSNFFGNPTPGRLALWLGVATIALYIVKDVLSILVSRWAIGFFLVQEAVTVRRLMHLYLHGSYREHLRTNSSEFVRTLNQSIRTVFGSGLVSGFNAAADLFSLVFVGLILVVSSPIVAVTAAVYFGVVAVAYQKIVHGILGQGARTLHVEQAKDFQTVRQALTAIKEIKVRGMEDHYRDEVYVRRRGLVSAYRTMALLSITPRYVLELAMIGATATIAGVAYSTMPLSTATSTLGLFLAGGFRIVAPLNKVIFGIGQAQASIPALEQVRHDFELFAVSEEGDSAATTPGVPIAKAPARQHPSNVTKLVPSEKQPAKAATTVPVALPADWSSAPLLEARNVCFSYEPGVPVLSDVSFTICAGEAVGLVGSTGAGKSTLLDVLLGLLKPDSGEIRIDGHSMQSVLGVWRATIGFVPQVISLFDDTVQANVALGVQAADVDPKDVWRALEMAQLDDVVRGLPGKLHTVIGEGGTRLSGGQRQRLGIARALYHGPSILMFDEATSSLDNETESRLIEVFENLRGEVATLTIAHRLSTVRRCSRVIYLDAGVVAAEGTFADLASTIPGFARLVELADLKISS